MKNIGQQNDPLGAPLLKICMAPAHGADRFFDFPPKFRLRGANLPKFVYILFVKMIDLGQTKSKQHIYLRSCYVFLKIFAL